MFLGERCDDLGPLGLTPTQSQARATSEPQPQSKDRASLPQSQAGAKPMLANPSHAAEPSRAHPTKPPCALCPVVVFGLTLIGDTKMKNNAA